ncbi:hypothetical protein TcasGA2_TC034583 [Tribolium castaneum]|uniref:Uncharacterized protein n=1 Tax=Tribolium castaneum TaxID=7070 RepID=A0A139WM65_TRICA|nr:hypothetical protein TcasGA2_TC034583 [Tribolium castaneum]
MKENYHCKSFESTITTPKRILNRSCIQPHFTFYGTSNYIICDMMVELISGGCVYGMLPEFATFWALFLDFSSSPLSRSWRYCLAYTKGSRRPGYKS